MYRGLGMPRVEDYRFWMWCFLLESLQGPRTASQRSGVPIGNEIQLKRSHSRKWGKRHRWLQVIYPHSEKQFDFGYEAESIQMIHATGLVEQEQQIIPQFPAQAINQLILRKQLMNSSRRLVPSASYRIAFDNSIYHTLFSLSCD